jgi:predicted CoA-binding protein
MHTKEKKTVVIGASPKPQRFSNAAVKKLKRYDHPVEAIGMRSSFIDDVEIKTGSPAIRDVHTVTLYIGPQNQPGYYDYILNVLRPKRIIFNPGTENDELKTLAETAGIEVVENCTLNMLGFGTF